jgi:hypothetical protein
MVEYDQEVEGTADCPAFVASYAKLEAALTEKEVISVMFEDKALYRIERTSLGPYASNLLVSAR